MQLLGSTSLGTVREGNGFWGLVVGCASVARKRVGGQTGGFGCRGLCCSGELRALQELVLVLGLEQGRFFSPWSVVQVLIMLISSCVMRWRKKAGLGQLAEGELCGDPAVVHCS